MTTAKYTDTDSHLWSFFFFNLSLQSLLSSLCLWHSSIHSSYLSFSCLHCFHFLSSFTWAPRQFWWPGSW